MDKKTGYIIVSIFGAVLAVAGLVAMLVVWCVGLVDYSRNADQAYERALHSNVEALTAAANDPKYQEQLRLQAALKNGVGALDPDALSKRLSHPPDTSKLSEDEKEKELITWMRKSGFGKTADAIESARQKAADVPDKSVPDKLDLWGCIKMQITVRGKSCPTYTVCPVVNEYCYGGIKTPMKEEYFQVSRSIQKNKTEREQIHIVGCDAWMTTNMKMKNSFGLVETQTGE
jgi:hypothetical protein